MKCLQCNKKATGWEYDDRFCSSGCAQKFEDVRFAMSELEREDCDFGALLDLDFDGSEF